MQERGAKISSTNMGDQRESDAGARAGTSNKPAHKSVELGDAGEQVGLLNAGGPPPPDIYGGPAEKPAPRSARYCVAHPPRDSSPWTLNRRTQNYDLHWDLPMNNCPPGVGYFRVWNIWRAQVALLGLIGYALAYGQRLAMPIAIVRMQVEFGWSKLLQGRLLASFYVGYSLMMPFGGLVAARFGGAGTVGAGMLGSSLLALAVPAAAARSPAHQTRAVLSLSSLLLDALFRHI